MAERPGPAVRKPRPGDRGGAARWPRGTPPSPWPPRPTPASAIISRDSWPSPAPSTCRASTSWSTRSAPGRRRSSRPRRSSWRARWATCSIAPPSCPPCSRTSRPRTWWPTCCGFPTRRSRTSKAGASSPRLQAFAASTTPSRTSRFWGSLLREARREVTVRGVYSPTRYPEIYRTEAAKKVRMAAFWPKVIFVSMLAVLVWLFCWLAVDVNLTSIHGLYRDRLASAFLIGADTRGDVDVEEDLDLGELCCHEAGSTAPYHLDQRGPQPPGQPGHRRSRPPERLLRLQQEVRRGGADGLLQQRDHGAGLPADEPVDGHGHLRRGGGAQHGPGHEPRAGRAS